MRADGRASRAAWNTVKYVQSTNTHKTLQNVVITKKTLSQLTSISTQTPTHYQARGICFLNLRTEIVPASALALSPRTAEFEARSRPPSTWTPAPAALYTMVFSSVTSKSTESG